jgi:hypothetical protein
MKKLSIKINWSGLYNFTIMPVLYSVVLWLSFSAAAVLFLEDFWRGIGVTSALALYQITRQHYSIDMRKAYEGMYPENAESPEA